MSAAPVFVVGCPRSGTSLLRDLLRSHPRISIPPESHFIPRFYLGWGDPGSAGAARALAARLLSMQPVRRWELELEPAAFSSCRSFAEVLEVLYGEFARVEGKSRWGDKTPHYVTNLPILAGLFPDARFIHIYRDPRDVVHSWEGRSFRPGNTYCGARDWRRMVATGRRDGATLGERYLEIRYETLVSAPGEAMRGACEFLDEPYAGEMVRRAERRPIYGEKQVRRKAEVDPAKAFEWRRRMPAADRAVVETVAGDLMSELGYELEGPRRPISAAQRGWWQLSGKARSTRNRVRNRQLSVANWLLVLRADGRRLARNVSH
jgi:hypothetical protein